jgi:hypothetical protein
LRRSIHRSVLSSTVASQFIQSEAKGRNPFIVQIAIQHSKDQSAKITMFVKLFIQFLLKVDFKE